MFRFYAFCSFSNNYVIKTRFCAGTQFLKQTCIVRHLVLFLVINYVRNGLRIKLRALFKISDLTRKVDETFKILLYFFPFHISYA